LISVLQLDTIDYATGLSLQRRLVELRKEGSIGDVLLLLEHSPVITLGRNAKRDNILASPELLARRGVDVVECDRGGDITFHGPGQLVGYPIFDLRGFPTPDGKRKTLGAIEYVRRLEEVLIRTSADFAIPTKRICGLTGVWTAPQSLSSGMEENASLGKCPEESTGLLSSEANFSEAKIAAIGVHISRGVTSHGFALNVDTDLDYFKLIVPCGITEKPVTSMAKELGKQLSTEEIAHSLSRNFGLIFNSQMLWLENLDALLSPKLGVPAKPPADLRELFEGTKEDTLGA
jgi:lipoyl(octanoyl) transferase